MFNGLQKKGLRINIMSNSRIRNTQKHFNSFLVLALGLFALGCSTGPSTPQHGVYFGNLVDQQAIHCPYTLKMGVNGMKVHPAGELIPGTGHHHLIINGGPIEGGIPVPNNETHIHFGKAQTEYLLDLKPGTYKLTLQFADGAHRSYGLDYSQSIYIKVE